MILILLHDLLITNQLLVAEEFKSYYRVHKQEGDKQEGDVVS